MWRGALAAASRVPGPLWSKYRTSPRQPFHPADRRGNPVFAEYDPSCEPGNLPRAGSLFPRRPSQGTAARLRIL